MRRLGVHTSIAGGLHLSLERAHRLGCTTMQIFTHSPRNWATKPIGRKEIAAFKKLRAEFDISPVYAHASYLINIASADSALRERSVRMLKEELKRADSLGLDYVVLHTGTAHDAGGRERASKSIREVLRRRGTSGAGLLIENTSGKRGDIASSVEYMAWLIEESGGRVAGICIDSCHAFSAGYDIRNERGVNKLALKIKRLIGRDKVGLIHLNDSKGLLGSGIDRHEHIGRGNIGLGGLGRLIRHRFFARVPIVLETPKESDNEDIDNLSAVRKLLADDTVR
jgi:deoxyribonuclease-4